LRQQRPFGRSEQFVLVDGWSLVAGGLEHDALELDRFAVSAKH
jgi:hypothetical protein